MYPFGFDPKWYITNNELQYFNSFKMKFAVIIGVLQMTLGIILKGLNSVYFGSSLDFIFEFVPQIVFLLALFGYMDLLIILKWLTDYTHRESEAPAIITQTINDFLGFGKISGSSLIVSKTFQMLISNTLLIVCLCCIPLMLLFKPIILNVHYQGVEARQKAAAEEKRRL